MSLRSSSSAAQFHFHRDIDSIIVHDFGSITTAAQDHKDGTEVTALLGQATALVIPRSRVGPKQELRVALGKPASDLPGISLNS